MKPLLAIAATLGLCAGFGMYYQHRKAQAATEPTAGDYVAIVDRSGSAENLDCGTLVMKVGEKLRDPSFRVGTDSKFALIGLGGSSHSEPRLALEIPLPRRNASVGARNGGRAVSAFLDKVRSACEATPAPEWSAIVRSVQVALQHMASRDCAHRTCSWLLISDGLETNDDAVRRYLVNSDPNAKPPITIANSIAPGTWCGFEQAGGSAVIRANRQLLTDRFASLFKQPLTMEPYCSAEDKVRIASRGR